MSNAPSPAARNVVTRGQEEKWAAKHHRLTRILGVCMIAGFVFILISAFFTDSLQIDILLIIGGCAILQGSQAWLRFYLSFSCLLCISQTIGIAAPLARGEPMELANSWVDYHDRAFWMEAMLLIGVYLGFAALCFITLRSRQLVFWTRTCKRWVKNLAFTAGVIVAIVLAFSLIGKKNYDLQVKQAAQSLQAAENYARDHESNISASDYFDLQKTLKADPAVRQLSIYNSPNGSMAVYDWNEKGSSDDGWHYEKFIRTKSGKRVMVKAKLKE